MIILKLIGGLGNQMFQYALGKRLSYKWQTSLKFDTSYYEMIALRREMLHFFNTEINVVSKKEIAKMISEDKVYKSDEVAYYNPRVFDLGPELYLEGFWQSEKYFKDIEDIIRKEFTLKIELGKENEIMFKKIKQSSHSISIHIRRSDYVTSKGNSDFYSSCSTSYYQQAVQIISKKYHQPTIFVFSDDIDWARKNVKFDFDTIYVNINSIDEGYKDMILMSNCQDNIIANSTFSWWAAWLNKNKNKMIISPKRWFNDSEISIKDLIPTHWMQLQNDD